jgi:glycosidase
MYDMLRNITSKNYPVREITNSWQSLGGIENKMLNFLENHDEQRIGSGFFSGNGSYAQPAMIVAATLTQAPVMIYCGQELGELGMDNEGFSGMDGRTTIFDYWGVKTIQAWTNGGKFDGKKLTSEQKELREFYKKLLNISISEKAITDGLMYDLEFANFDNPKFNSHEQYAYFRKYEDELILFVLNFDDKQLETEVIFPLEAFQFLELEEGNRYSFVNLLDDKDVQSSISLSSKQIFLLQMPAWRGKILKLTRVNHD